MRDWANRTSTMITVTILLLLLIAFSGLYAGYTNFVVQQDAEIIHDLGVIRGGVQRLVHLALAGTVSPEMYEEIDVILARLRTRPQFVEHMPAMEITWEAMKSAVARYQAEPSSDLHQEIFALSEVLWGLSSGLVLSAQAHAQRKIHNYSYVAASFSVCIMFLGALLVWLKQYVQDSLEFLTRHDSLTKAANKKYFDERFRLARNHAQRHQQPLSLLVIDIDHFKEINDTFGHSVGDRVLEEFTAVLQKNLDDSHLLARVGGEEFAVIAPGVRLQDGLALGERLRQAVEETEFPGVGKLTISVGAAEFQLGETEDDLFRRADAALYCAKAGGRNQTAG